GARPAQAQAHLGIHRSMAKPHVGAVVLQLCFENFRNPRVFGPPHTVVLRPPFLRRLRIGYRFYHLVLTGRLQIVLPGVSEAEPVGKYLLDLLTPAHFIELWTLLVEP